MSWERRKTGWFYYRAVKRHGKVEKTYIGAGAVGKAAAALVAEARWRRADEATALAAERDRLAGPLDAMAALDRACSRAIEAALTAAGYHSVDYKWRRKRVPRPERTDD